MKYLSVVNSVILFMKNYTFRLRARSTSIVFFRLRSKKILVLILAFLCTTAFAQQSKACSEQELTFENGSFSVHVLQFSSINNNSTNAILIIPPTGGINYLDIKYAKYFCKKGVNTFILSSWTNDDEYNLELEIHNRYMGRAQRALFLTLESLSQYKFGVLGTSAGGFIANVAMGNERFNKYVHSYFSIVSGSPICSVIAHAGEKTLKEVREIRTKIYKFNSIKDYEVELCETMTWKVPKEKDSNIKFAAINSLRDKTVPSQYQYELISNWQPDLLIHTRVNHFLTIIGSYYLHKERVFNFLKDDALK